MTALRDFFGLTTTPFTKSIDSQNLYASRGHRELVLPEALRAGIHCDLEAGQREVDRRRRA